MPSYHHGDLRQALIDATEELLAERGPEAFSLREVARRAGVSPAAPAHHFGDAGGLLTAVAIVAFDGLTHALQQGEAREGTDPRARLVGQGLGYVAFAMRHPGRFRLMFSDRVKKGTPELERSGNEAFLMLENGIRAAFALAPGAQLPEQAWTALLAVWSAVHGYAHLAIAGRLDHRVQGTRNQMVEKTLRPMLERIVAGCVLEAAAPRRPRARKSRAEARPMRR